MSEPRTTTAPAPPIEAIDEPAPEWNEPVTAEDDGSDVAILCVGDDGSAAEDPCAVSPETQDKLRKQEEALTRALAPAKGTEPRSIAQLQLLHRTPGTRAVLTAWRNEAGALCLASDEETPDGGGGEGPYGPCVPRPGCTAICLDVSQSGSGNETRYTLMGAVDSDGTQLRLSLDDGRAVTYDLSGPLVPGFREYRVFMVDLGRDLYERIELLRDEKLIGEEKQRPGVNRSMRCMEKHPFDDMPRSPDEAAKSPLAQCFEKSGAK